jgi:hypothetical protein
MSVMHETHDMKEASTASLAAVVGILIASALAFTAMTAPIAKLLGSGGGAVPAAFHGMAAFLYLFVGTIGLYLGWRLLTGRIRAFADLQLLATVSATFALIAIGFGNWLALHLLPREDAGQPALALPGDRAGDPPDLLRVQGVRRALHAAPHGGGGVHPLEVRRPGDGATVAALHAGRAARPVLLLSRGRLRAGRRGHQAEVRLTRRKGDEP